MSTVEKTETAPTEADGEFMPDYDSHVAELPAQQEQKVAAAGGAQGSYAGLHSATFRELSLEPELLRAVTDAGFENPSEVQQQCIPQAIIGQDIICQAKAGMGKTAVFVLAILQQIKTRAKPAAGDRYVDSLVLCHTRDLAYQIGKAFERFKKYIQPEVKCKVLIGGLPIDKDRKSLEAEVPDVIIGSPGRIKQLLTEKKLNLSRLRRFVIDECDHLLQSLDMRADVQAIFKQTPVEKQVMLFSATLPQDVRVVARKFTNNAQEVLVEDRQLTISGLQQYVVELEEAGKNRKLTDLLDALEYNQVMIFVNSVRRCKELAKLLNECNFPSLAVHGDLPQPERIELYNQFKNTKERICVSTDIYGRGIDFEKVNIVVNYDMPSVDDKMGLQAAVDKYLHRVNRSARHDTKGLAVSFVSSQGDRDLLVEIRKKFGLEVPPLPDEIDISSYMTA